MKERQDTAPFLKWAGGKRQLLHEITKLLPKDIGSRKYYELFVGGGALLFHLQPVNGFINDSNPELTNAYRTVRDNLGELLEALRQHEALNSAEHFYEVRALDRDPGLGRLSPVERAARMIYLNQTCYNGLYRVNGSGFFNTPYGKYRNPHIADTTRLTAASRFLNANCIRIACGDYADQVGEISTRSFVYLDPPYQPRSLIHGIRQRRLDGRRPDQATRLLQPAGQPWRALPAFQFINGVHQGHLPWIPYTHGPGDSHD